jgi:Rha family phage regulatory protein
MNELQVIDQPNRPTLDSREVAEMVGKNHSHLLRDIQGYAGVMSTNPNLDSLSFFVPSTYQDTKGETRPCYLITRKGCDMVANKMTGEKGVIFTAMYVTRFEEMEKALTAPSSIEDLIIMQAQSMKELKAKVNAVAHIAESTQKEINNLKDALIHHDKDWRNWVNTQLQKIGFITGDYSVVRTDSYKHLEERAHCRLSVRLENLKDRLRREGATHTLINKTNYMDVIEVEPRLKEIYTTIVKEMAIRYAS